MYRNVLLASAIMVATPAAAEDAPFSPSFTPVFAFKTAYGSADIGGPAWESDADLGFTWRPLQNISVVGNLEARQPITDRHFADLVSDTGSLTGLADGTTGGPLLRLEKLYMRAELSDATSIILGRLHFEDHLLDNALSSKSAAAFQNEAFSAKPAIAFPRDAMGLVLSFRATDRLTFSAVAGDAARNDEFDVIAEGAVFGALQADLRWAPSSLSDGHYRVAIWSRGDGASRDFGEAGGVAVSIDQPVTENTVLMLRAHSADDAMRASTLGAAAAIGWNGNLWDRPGDQFGLGVAFLDPSDSTRDVQEIAEAYYRWQAHPLFAITPTLQIIGHGRGPLHEENSTYLGVRCRLRIEG